MPERKYTEHHEWLEINDSLVTIGVTGFAQSQLGDIVFVELPEEGDELSAGDEAIVIESVKAAGEIGFPFDGVVEEVNALLAEAPETINAEPLTEGWMMKVRLDETPDFSSLMDEEEYKVFVSEC
jgi:glycine cleavage system H protein